MVDVVDSGVTVRNTFAVVVVLVGLVLGGDI